MTTTEIFTLQAKVLGTLSPEIMLSWELKSCGSSSDLLSLYARDPEAKSGYLSGRQTAMFLNALYSIGCTGIIGNVAGEPAPVIFISSIF